MAHTNFDEWLDSNVSVSDLDEAWAVYQSVLRGNDYYPFTISKKGKRSFLKREGREDVLMISGENAEMAFLNMLDYTYSELGGVEAAKAIEDHNDED